MCVLCVGCAAHGPKAGHDLIVPDEAAGAKEAALRVERVLADAGDNAPELLQFLNLYEPGTPRHRAAWFLVANLPVADAVSMSADELAEYVDYAFIARGATPWGPSIPWSIFLRYVVPHRSAQEPAQPHRRRFFEQLSPMAVASGDIRRATLAVNRWLFSRAGYAPSSRRDQGVMDTLLRGSGRCEELAIAFIAACRAVCIPARPCLVPAWRHSDGNHLWVEIWAEGGWWPIGAGEMDSDFGVGWFIPPALSAAVAIAPAYGNGPSDEPVFATRRGCTVYNRTEHYTPNGTIAVEIFDEGRPVPAAEAIVFVPEGGGFRRLGRIVCDGRGRGAMDVGGGDYLLGTGRDGRTDYAWVRVEAGGFGGASLDLARERLPEGDRWVRFARYPDIAQALGSAYEAIRAARSEYMNVVEARRLHEFAAIAGITSAVMERGGLARRDEAMVQVRAAGRRGYEVLRLLTRSDAADGETLLDCLLGMSAKDLVAMDVDAAADEARLIAGLRGVSGEGDAAFAAFVMPGRVDDEPHSHWRRAFAERFASLAGRKAPVVATAAVLAAGELRVVESGPLGPPLTLLQNLETGLAAGRRERAAFAVAILRSLGHPARMLRDADWAEYLDGGRWWPLYPGRADAMDDARVAAWYGERGELELRLEDEEGRVAGAAAVYGRDMLLARPLLDGGLEPLDDPDMRYDVARGATVFSLPAGRYLLTLVRRDAQGQPYVRIRTVDIAPGGGVSVVLPLDLPAGGPPGDLG
nr:transglutaminase-like domain-containing protein [Desulfobaculum xiamenense]